MKLTEIAIEGNTHSGRFQFGPLDRGLNFVYGENGAGKTFLVTSYAVYFSREPVVSQRRLVMWPA